MTYVISDIHGYSLYKIMELFDRVDFGEEDFCYCLGDVIDRGPDGVETLLWMMDQPNIELILGNHEAMLLSCDFLFDGDTVKSTDDLDGLQMQLYMNWAHNGCEPTLEALKKLSAEERGDLIDFLRCAPLYTGTSVDDTDYIFTHSGFENFAVDRPLEDYAADELIWNRPKMTDRYYDDMTVVFGHTPTCFLDEAQAGKVIFTDTWIDIDCGVSCGYAPAMLCLDDMQVYYAES